MSNVTEIFKELSECLSMTAIQRKVEKSLLQYSGPALDALERIYLSNSLDEIQAICQDMLGNPLEAKRILARRAARQLYQGSRDELYELLELS